MQPISYPRFTLTEQHWPWQQSLANLHLVSTRFSHSPLNDHDLAHYNFALPSSLDKAAPKRRAEFMAGRLCARRALWLVQGKESVPSIGQDRAPLWPEGAVGSISHSDSWAAAVVAEQAHYLGLGLDIERCLSNVESQKLIPGILTAAERSRVCRLDSEQLGIMVTLIFSLKESLFKALYPLVGLHFYFADAELIEWNMTTGTARLRLLCHLGPSWRRGTELSAYFYHSEAHIISLVALPAHIQA